MFAFSLFLIIVIIVIALARTLYSDDPDIRLIGYTFGCMLSASFALFLVISSEENRPQAIDVYRGNTEMKVTSINNIPCDTIIVFKNDLDSQGR